MPILPEKKQLMVAAFSLLLLAACGENKKQEPVPETKIKSAATAILSVDTTQKQAITERTPNEETVVAFIRTTQYELKLFKPIAFVPKQENAEGIRLKPDHHYLVLDISVQNTSKTKEVDMAQVLLSAKLQDKKGRTYPLNAMAVAAFTMENPDPQHQAQYNALWGKLKPGEMYRTKAIGFDVPTTAREFVLSMNADDNSQPDAKRQQLKFTLE